MELLFHKIYILCVIGLLLAFGFQVQDQFTKFLNGDKTVTTSLVNEDLTLPVFSICPGYKTSLKNQFKWINEVYDEDYPSTLEEHEDIWNNITYEANDFMKANLFNMQNDIEDFDKILVREAWMGKCFTIDTNANSNWMLYLEVNLLNSDLTGCMS